MVKQLLENDSVISLLMEAMSTGEGTLKQFPELLKRVIREEMWRDREMQANGCLAHFDRFEKFVSDLPREGLGADIALLKNLCRDDPEAIDLIDRALKDSSRQGERTDFLHNIQEVRRSQAPTGTSSAVALRRLRSQRPDLHRRVLAKELSPHAAMLEAGFRRHTLTVPADPEGAARVLARHFGPDDLTLLVKHLLSAETVL